MGIAYPSPTVAYFDPRDEAPDQSPCVSSVRASRKDQEQSSHRGDDVALMDRSSEMNEEKRSEADEEFPEGGLQWGGERRKVRKNT